MRYGVHAILPGLVVERHWILSKDILRTKIRSLHPLPKRKEGQYFVPLQDHGKICTVEYEVHFGRSG